MRIGIVGSEAAKFTDLGEVRAKVLICDILNGPDVTEVVSGGCHLGGIDQWAAEIGRDLGLIVTEYLPEARSWQFYKERNLKIARRSDYVYCITVDQLPPGYTGMRFDYCYHCKTNNHVKSGGCWTMWQAIALGKRGELRIVCNS